jgi:hypothetical protein
LASYYLLARDIERLDGFRPAAKPLAAIIADSNRREAATSVTRAKLPSWVQQMAPPEVKQPQVDRDTAAGATVNGSDLGADWELLADAESAIAYPEAEPALAGLSDELIAFLSQAMDSDVEVEITSEIMTDLNNTGTTERLSPEVLEALELFEASVSRELNAVQAAPAHESERPEYNVETDLSPLEIYLTWAEESRDQAAATDEQPADAELTAAEVALALENSIRSESDGEAIALESATPSESAEVAIPEESQAKTRTTNNGRKVAQRTKSNDVIPWYVALLIIIAVIVLVIAFLYVALSADILPATLSFELFRDLPLLN